MRVEIVIHPTEMTADELLRHLNAALDESIKQQALVLDKRKPRFRELDTAVVVATIGVIGASLASLINAIFALAKERASQKIVLQSQKGLKIEFPANLGNTEIDTLIEKVRAMDDEKISIRIYTDKNGILR